MSDNDNVLAIFDLDETLIRSDCVDLWLLYCRRNKIIDESIYEAHVMCLNDYASGYMDMDKYMDLVISPLACMHRDDLERHVEKFVASEIKPIINQSIYDRLLEHQANNHRVVVASASPEFLVNSIAKLLNVDDVVAIRLKGAEGYLSGNIEGVPSYREGKVVRMFDWMECNFQYDYSLGNAYFYSDSHNDLPLLMAVNNPVAVNPDSILRRYAVEKSWKIIE